MYLPRFCDRNIPSFKMSDYAVTLMIFGFT